MNIGTNNRLIVTKSILWFLVGAAFVAAVVRFAKGLGATTALSDATPWGIWIGLDVISGVALAAGGFVIAAAVYILGRERYHALLRPAILTAFLGYLAVILGLVIDLGKPWNLWRPIFFRNLHSPLFEVAMCVMAYTAVLALEFAPVGLAPFGWAKPIVRILRKLTLPLVILGIALSSLHQSSLGTLFLLTPDRMHPLWYSPLMPLLFLISAVGLGLAMVTLESLVTSWLYRKETEWPELTGLIRASAAVLGLYLVVRLVDLAVRGHLGGAFDGSTFASLFWVEISMSVLVPIALLTLPSTRGTRWAVAWSAVLVVAGLILHRADVGGISHLAVTGEAYLPAPSEVLLSLGVISTLGLIFLFCVEHLHVWEIKPEAPGPFTPPAIDPLTSQFIRSPWLGGGKRAVLATIVGMVAGLALMEVQLARRAEPRAQTIRPPRTVLARVEPRQTGPGHLFQLVSHEETKAAVTDSVRSALLLDGGGAGRFVLFQHEAHQDRLGGRESCAQCHHRNVPMARGTSCSECHSDMYRTTDTFDHEKHADAYEGKTGCVVCHVDPAEAKTRYTAGSDCDRCHPPVEEEATRIRPSADFEPGMAVGYRQALHQLCIECHREHEAPIETAGSPATEYLSRCTTCHRTEIPDRFEAPIPLLKTELVRAGGGMKAGGAAAHGSGEGGD